MKMRKSLDDNLTVASAAMEEIVTLLSKMKMDEKVDVCARIRAIAKHCETLDKAIKKDIKAELKDKPGTVNGKLFKALLSDVPVDRFDGTLFKEKNPVIYAKYTYTSDEKRVNFEPR